MDKQTFRDRPIIALATSSSIIGLGIYRPYLSLKAKFPSPNLAALTLWDEFYYELVQNGQFTFHIQELHKIYATPTHHTAYSPLGPIVRITAEVIHVQGVEFYKELYVKSVGLDKCVPFSNRYVTDQSLFTTAACGHHRLRRGASYPYFSKMKIVYSSPLCSVI